MKSLEAKVTSKGQVTLPKELRDSLRIREGDRIRFTVTSPRQARLETQRAPGSSAGLLRHLAKAVPPTVQEMDEAVAKAVSRKYKRNISGRR
jgi:antitoxin PrlF